MSHRSRFGTLIAGGNKVSEYGNKSRRKWYPNVQDTRWWSDILQRNVRIKCTARAIKVGVKTILRACAYM